MTETHLILRATVIGGDRLKDDYSVIFQERSVGLIRYAHERSGQAARWDYHVNLPLPIPSWANGTSNTLEDATAAFREVWARFYATLTPEAIAHWHQVDDALR
ncbi:MAG: hypothetical protein WA418_07940 [Bradyrhizobium sp.]